MKYRSTMASPQVLQLLIPGIIVIILKELSKDNVQQSKDFTNTKKKRAWRLLLKKDSELIRIIDVYAPSRDAGIKRLILHPRDLCTDMKNVHAGHFGCPGPFFSPMYRRENLQQNVLCIVSQTS